MSGNDYIQPDDLLLSESNVMANITLNKEKPLTLSLVRRKAETLAIYGAMEKVDGNVSKAAKLLDVSRPTLYALIERLDIDFNQAQ
jgi:two-component system NtrC family response regulator